MKILRIQGSLETENQREPANTCSPKKMAVKMLCEKHFSGITRVKQFMTD